MEFLVITVIVTAILMFVSIANDESVGLVIGLVAMMLCIVCGLENKDNERTIEELRTQLMEEQIVNQKFTKSVYRTEAMYNRIIEGLEDELILQGENYDTSD